MFHFIKRQLPFCERPLSCALWVTLVALFLLAPSVSLAQVMTSALASSENAQWCVVSGSHVNVRSAPNLAAARIRTYRQGTRLLLLQVHAGWVLVRHPKTAVIGWMHAAYVRDVTPKEAAGSLVIRKTKRTIATAALAGRGKEDANSVPYPERKLRVYVYGDSLATNLFHGMKSMESRDGFYTVRRRTRGATGLVRDDEYDWFGRMGRYLKIDRPDVAVVTFGGNDRQDLRTGQGRLRRFTRRWWQEYRRRVDRFMGRIKRHSRHVYWLGLPVLRSQRMTADYKKFNRLYREIAGRHEITYIDVWEMFQSPSGGYSAFGPTVDGERRRLRHVDGIHFSNHGSRKLAQAVIDAIRRGTGTDNLAAR